MREGRQSWFLRGVALLRSALREIFDEAAYERFLVQRQAAPSRESYAKFVRDREAAGTPRARCC